MVGQQILDLFIGVRVPAPQQNNELGEYISLSAAHELLHVRRDSNRGRETTSSFAR
jgi:hypothetical protein